VADDDKKGGQGQGPAAGQGGGQGDGGQGQGDGQGGIEAMVRRVVAELLPKGRSGGAAEHDVTAQVEAAVTKVHQGQQAAQVIADLERRLKEVEEKKVPERKPKEYRSITKRIWGPDDDE
jgi:hypothetical protein